MSDNKECGANASEVETRMIILGEQLELLETVVGRMPAQLDLVLSQACEDPAADTMNTKEPQAPSRLVTELERIIERVVRTREEAEETLSRLQI